VGAKMKDLGWYGAVLITNWQNVRIIFMSAWSRPTGHDATLIFSQ